MIPSKVFFTKGAGVHRERLASFEWALRDAGIAQYNLVSVSSCKKISRDRGIKMLKPGEIIFCVLARNESNEPNRLLGAAIGSAIPKGQKKYGYLSEHHCFGETEEKAGDYAEDLAASMLASTLGLKFNLDDAWDTRKQAYKLSGKIVYTSNVTQTARGEKNGLWTSVVAAAVFVP